MGEFIIGTTDFGIDPESALFEIVLTDRTTALLTVEFDGRQDDFERIREERGEEWGWASYPPSFYLRDFPVPMPEASAVVLVPLDRQAYREYEVALYMMEHNTVEGTILLKDGEQIEITGQVELIGKPTPFRIRWGNPTAAPDAGADGGS